VIEILDIVAYALDEPQLDAEVLPGVRRLQQVNPSPGVHPSSRDVPLRPLA
jgi:hypothetical protein